MKDRKQRVRYKTKKVTNRNRLSIFRSNNHIYAQLIDDSTAKTIATSSTLDKVLSSKIKKTATKEASFLVGQNIGEKAREKNVTTKQYTIYNDIIKNIIIKNNNNTIIIIILMI